ncbi:MAG: phosphate signaling complex PhoU family protein [Bacillota bacterium]
MMENPRTITLATHLLFVSRYLERISDHATNIGEEVVFLVTGKKSRVRQSIDNEWIYAAGKGDKKRVSEATGV